MRGVDSEQTSAGADPRWQKLLEMDLVQPGDMIFYADDCAGTMRQGEVQDDGRIKKRSRGSNVIFMDPVALVLRDDSWASNCDSNVLEEHKIIFDKCALLDEDETRVPLQKLLQDASAALEGADIKGQAEVVAAVAAKVVRVGEEEVEVRLENFVGAAQAKARKSTLTVCTELRVGRVRRQRKTRGNVHGREARKAQTPSSPK